jgi:hypothetical protein
MHAADVAVHPLEHQPYPRRVPSSSANSGSLDHKLIED